MQLELMRFSSGNDSTLGIMSEKFTNGDRKFICFTLEDEARTQKVFGKTRIPSGSYPIKLRKVGGFHGRYSTKFPSMHKGMLWLQDVPGFEFILIHIGNDDKNTEGCILVGDTCEQNITKRGFVGTSTNAYKRIYPPIAAALEVGRRVTLSIIDFD
jgi:hypothetical protein